MSPRTRRWGLYGLVVAVLGGFVVAVLTLSAEDDPYAAYCAEVEARQASIGAAMAGPPTTALLRALPSFRALAARAPRDISDEWSLVTDRIGRLNQALRDADVDPDSYDAAAPPEGIGEEDVRAITAAGVQLGSADMQAALAGVDQQARDVCQLALGL